MLIKRLFVKEQQDFRPMSSPRFSSGSCPRWQQRDAPASRAPNQYLYPWFPPAFGPSPPFQTIKHTLTICTMISILTIAASALAFSSVAYSAPAELAPSNGTATISNYTVYYECNPSNLKWAEIKNIQIGRDYLNGLPGKAKIAGGKHCDRVSCSYNSAIFYCNDVGDPAVFGLLLLFKADADCDRMITRRRSSGRGSPNSPHCFLTSVVIRAW